MSKVEARGPIDPPPLMPSCNLVTFFRFMPSRVKAALTIDGLLVLNINFCIYFNNAEDFYCIFKRLK